MCILFMFQLKNVLLIKLYNFLAKFDFSQFLVTNHSNLTFWINFMCKIFLRKISIFFCQKWKDAHPLSLCHFHNTAYFRKSFVSNFSNHFWIRWNIPFLQDGTASQGNRRSRTGSQTKALDIVWSQKIVGN